MAEEVVFRDLLRSRRERLEGAISEVGEAEDLVRLLREVDSALGRLDARTFGECEACHDRVEDDFLVANPLMQYCLCRLTEEQQEALQRDLDLASRVQWALLPKQDLTFAGWEVHYRYLPAGPVSGDYCDVITPENGDGSLYFLVGDVSGKGVAASFLMARLNAMFRSLIDVDRPLEGLVERANQLFGESSLAAQYATLVCGKARKGGAVEVCNAGHHAPFLLRDGGAEPIDAAGFPVGLFSARPYTVSRFALARGEALFLYTDGLIEARNRDDEEYGPNRLSRFLREGQRSSPRALAAACLHDLRAFLAGAARTDDLSIMVLRRTA